ncbi:MAG: hypothetical protein OXI87_07165 [Albidovulum sp.]|nr:hypothetical protein [Albidovulum sp.]
MNLEVYNLFLPASQTAGLPLSIVFIERQQIAAAAQLLGTPRKAALEREASVSTMRSRVPWHLQGGKRF